MFFSTFRTNPQNAKVYVDVLLEQHHKYSQLVKDAFESDPLFVTSLEKACRTFVNNNAVTAAAKSTSKSPELLAKYCDSLLKKSAKNPEEDELEKLMQDVMIAFKFVDDKGQFGRDGGDARVRV